MGKNKKFRFIMLIILCIIALFGFMFYSLSPKLSDFRNSIYGLILFCVVLDGIILYVILSKKINQPILGKITTGCFGLLYTILSFIPIGGISSLLFFIYSIINILISIYIYRKMKKEYKSIWIFGALSYLISVFWVLRIKMISSEFNLTFLLPSIIIAMLVFIPCLIYGIKQNTKKRNLEKAICIPLLGLFGTFVFCWLTIASMNVYLDFSKPNYVECLILDKNIRTGARSMTKYEFKVENNDKAFYIGVPQDAYYDYEINDTIILSIYQGAFHVPYYIYDHVLPLEQ